VRYAVEYESPSGVVGLCIFSSDSLEAAQKYVENMTNEYGYTSTFNLNELANSAGIEELYRLFPSLANTTNRGRNV
jgi:hypothetical protein